MPEAASTKSDAGQIGNILSGNTGVGDITMRVEILEGPKSLESICVEWNNLHRRAAPQNPFVTIDWLTAWLKRFASEAHLIVLTVWEGQRLTAGLPLLNWKGNMVPFPCLMLPYNIYADFPQPLIDLDRPEAAGALAVTLRDQLDWRSCILWRNADLSARGFDDFRHAAAEADLEWRQWRGQDAAWVSVDGNWPTYLKSVQGQREKRRNERRLAKAGELVFKVRQRPDEVGPAMEDLMQVSAASWQTAAGTGEAVQPDLFDFLYRIAEKFSRFGGWRCYFLILDGRPISYDFSLFVGGRLHGLKVAYDQGFGRFSPGHVLNLRVLESAFADPEIGTVEFLGAYDSGKRAWTQLARPRSSVLIWPRGGAGGQVRWWFKSLRRTCRDLIYHSTERPSSWRPFLPDTFRSGPMIAPNTAKHASRESVNGP